MSQNTATPSPVTAVPPIPSVTPLITGTSDEYQRVFNLLLQAEVKVERKGELNYVSWSDAIDTLLRICPDAQFKICDFGGELLRNVVTGEFLVDDFGDPRIHNGEPYQKTVTGFYVKAKVKVKGVVREMRLPVMDQFNNPIQSPSTFDINTSGMRCLVKAIALHGLGMFVYQGEDLPRTLAANDKTSADGKKNKEAKVKPEVKADAKAEAKPEVKAEPKPDSPQAAAPDEPSKAPVTTLVVDLKREIARLKTATTATLLKRHQMAETVFKGRPPEELAQFRQALALTAQEMNVTLPPLSPPEAQAAA